MRLTWPLTGRSNEMRLIEAAISDPSVPGVVICGAAGVGKSRVAREALDAAAARGHEVRWVVGTSCARDLPLGALASWAGLAGNDSLQVVCGVIDSLTVASSAATVVVGVDDVHLLDDLSTFVLHQIVQRRAAKVVVTVRDGEAIPVGVQELWKDGQFDRIDLRPLASEETTTLLCATLAGALDPAVADRLWQLTRGNVLYLRHIVEQEVANGRLGQAYGSWHWTGDAALPHGLVELVETRIGSLPEAVGAVIDALAVGEPLELAALRRITDSAAVEEADMRGLIMLEDTETGIEVRVAHPLYGEVRRSRVAPTRLRRMRGLVAAELARADSRDEMRVLVRRAALTIDSDAEPDPDLLLRAAQGAVCLADLALAERLAAAAVRAGAGAEAEFVRAHALSWLGDGQHAEEVLAGVAVGRLSDQEHARFTYLRASNMLWALADPARARDIIDAAASVVTGPAARSCIDAVRTVYWFAVDRPDAASVSAQNLVLHELPAIVGAETAWALTVIGADAGTTARAVAMAEDGYAVATRCSDAPHMRFNIADAHIGALLLAGRVADANDVAERARRQAADLPGAAQFLGVALAGRATLGAGHVESACALLEEAVVALSAAGHAVGWGYRYRVPYATALAVHGRTDAAAAVLAALEGSPRPFRSLDDERSLARAWIASARGAVREAISIARSAAGMAAGHGRFAAEVMCLQTAVQFGDHSCERRLRELEESVEGPRVALAARFATALRDHDPGELCVLSVCFEECGDLLGALDAAAHAAVMYRRQELRGSALSWSSRAEALAERCGGAQTPALREARVPLPLTGREREIALLVAAGLSNRDIADRLTLSVRTVEGHVYKAMTKTGTTTREELAALLSPRPENAGHDGGG